MTGEESKMKGYASFLARVLGVISRRELAGVLGVNEDTIRRWVKGGRWPRGMKVGGQTVWPLWRVRQRLRAYGPAGTGKVGSNGSFGE